MRLGGQRASHNVEDRRGMGMAAGGLGVGGIVIAVIAYFLGFDPGMVTQMVEQTGAPQQQVGKATPSDDAGQFVAKVLGSTEDVWSGIFRRSGAEYRAPTLVLFEGQVRTGCGVGQSAMGPFYCPGDQKLYVDLSFFRTLHSRLGAPGDFAQAYVIAHEVAHHVQHLTGAMRGPRSNAQSVRVELQADCYAGVWGYHANAMNLLEAGDREEGLNAALAIGDDRLQRQAQGRVVPESFTHGSSEQRRRWLQRGLESGNPQACDTSAG
jgi:predicted metalloprotease